MKTLAELRAQLGELDSKRKAFEAAHKDKGMSAEDRTVFAAMLDEIEGVLEEIKLAERSQSVEAAAAAPAPQRVGLEIHDVASEAPYSFGEYLQDIAMLAIKGVQSPRLKRRQQIQAAASGMSEAVPADGGFLIGKDNSTTLVQKAHETGKLPGLCNRIPIGANSDGVNIPTIDETSRATGSRLGGIRVYRKNEAASATGSKMKFGKLALDLEDMIGLCYVTNNMLQDATSLGAIVSGAFAKEFGFKLDDEIVNGTGAGQCLGFLASPALVTITKETGQSADTLNVQNIIKMDARFWEGPAGAGVWVANRDIKPQLYSLQLPVGTGGIPAFMPMGGLSGKPYDTLMGRQIIFAEQAATLGDAGDISLVDLSEYLLIDKGGIQEAASLHVNFTTNEMAFRFVYRVNGQPTWSQPLTPYKGTGNTLSPFVTLGARA